MAKKILGTEDSFEEDDFDDKEQMLGIRMAERRSKALLVERLFTKKNQDVYSTVKYELRDSVIRNPDGSVVFEIKNVEVPASWSQMATDVLAQKYFRKKGVPQYDSSGKPLTDNSGKQILGGETSIKQVVKRLSKCWRHWGEKFGYFESQQDADAFEDEIAFMLLNQMAAPNSPQWFNTGLNLMYGISGPAQGHFYADHVTGEIKSSTDSYSRPQVHACFILSLKDDLVGEGGIFDLVTREARLYKYGSGTGTNFSALRGSGETLSGGGVSSGLMSFLKIFDRAAGAIKSGGTTRRAAKMVCLDADHPEIEAFIDWKMIEEQKVAALITGAQNIKDIALRINTLIKHQKTEKDKEVRKVIKEGLAKGIPINYMKKIVQGAKLGQPIDIKQYDTYYENEAYLSVSGQNSNNSVRISHKFMDAVASDGQWNLLKRTDGKPFKTIKAKDLWNRIANSAWACADPGIQYDDTINEWHTCPMDGRINASNPCVTGDTLVLTDQGRWQRIDSMLDKQTVLITNTGELSKGFTNGSFKTGIKPVYLLETKSGYTIKLTADHKVYVAGKGFVPACEMTKDDRVLIPKHAVAAVEELPEQKARVFQLIGLYLGDCCSHGNKIQITMDKQQDFPVLEAVGEYSTESFNSKPHQAQALNALQAQTIRKLNPFSQSALEEIGKYLDLAQKSSEKEISSAIFGLALCEQRYVLQGLFTATGHVANYGLNSQFISLDSTSLSMLKGVQIMLLGFGIKSKIYKNRRACNETALLTDGNGGVKEYDVEEVHSLRISKSGIIAFETLIGFMPESYKEQQLKDLNQVLGTYEDSPYDQVASMTFIGEQEVFDLTEPLSNSFIANGITVHNCSEYMFLDDTACNLASLNLLKFYDEESGIFDVEKFKHATRLWTIVLEISVGMAQYPAYEIAKRSYEYRTLGLGYANLGALLMRMGIPYDSEEGTAIAGSITAIMCGISYYTSSEMAKCFGTFKHYERNKQHMLRVIKNHRRAAYNAEPKEYEGLKITPFGINQGFCPTYLLKEARMAWDKALSGGEKYGYRNAQVTVIAPTGTIGLVMDCDTTGIEPDFALVKFKKLAGGGYFKIVNQSVPKTLKTLGYSEQQINEIVAYCIGKASIDGCPYINKQTLEAKGFGVHELELVEKQLKTAFDIRFAFSKFILGENFLKKLGIPEEKIKGELDVLKELGFTDSQIEEANYYVCGTMTVEGAPHLKKEHYAVFDCANKCGKKGTRFIKWTGHVKMMAAVQPFITGSISKTINLPGDATVEDVLDAHRLAYEMMLKSIAIYRDGSKLSQPLSSKDDALSAELYAIGNEEEYADETVTPEAVQQVIKDVQTTPQREMTRIKLPTQRRGLIQEANIGGQKIYLRTGEYPDGTLGEIFIDMYKEGASYRSLLNCFAVAVSKALQYGVPLEEFVDSFTFTRFEPSGTVQGHPAVKRATSILDFVFRVIGYEYMGRKDLAHVQPENGNSNTNGTTTHELSKRIETNSMHGNEVHEIQCDCSVPKPLEKKDQQTVEKKSEPEGNSIVNRFRSQGYTGDMCAACGSMRMRRSGTCSVCEDCGSTSGCS